MRVPGAGGADDGCAAARARCRMARRRASTAPAGGARPGGSVARVTVAALARLVSAGRGDGLRLVGRFGHRGRRPGEVTRAPAALTPHIARTTYGLTTAAAGAAASQGARQFPAPHHLARTTYALCGTGDATPERERALPEELGDLASNVSASATSVASDAVVRTASIARRGIPTAGLERQGQHRQAALFAQTAHALGQDPQHLVEAPIQRCLRHPILSALPRVPDAASSTHCCRRQCWMRKRRAMVATEYPPSRTAATANSCSDANVRPRGAGPQVANDRGRPCGEREGRTPLRCVTADAGTASGACVRCPLDHEPGPRTGPVAPCGVDLRDEPRRSRRGCRGHDITRHGRRARVGVPLLLTMPQRASCSSSRRRRCSLRRRHRRGTPIAGTSSTRAHIHIIGVLVHPAHPRPLIGPSGFVVLRLHRPCTRPHRDRACPTPRKTFPVTSARASSASSMAKPEVTCEIVVVHDDRRAAHLESDPATDDPRTRHGGIRDLARDLETAQLL